MIDFAKGLPQQYCIFNYEQKKTAKNYVPAVCRVNIVDIARVTLNGFDILFSFIVQS